MSAMATAVEPPITLPVRRTFLDEEDEDPFMYQERDYEEEMAILAATENLSNEVELATAAAAAGAGNAAAGRPMDLSPVRHLRNDGRAMPVSSEPVPSSMPTRPCAGVGSMAEDFGNAFLAGTVDFPPTGSCVEQSVSKRRRLNGKQKPPHSFGVTAVHSPTPAYWVSSESPEDSASASVLRVALPETGSDLVEEDNPELWRKKWRGAYFVLRKFFYNTPQLHDIDALHQAENHEERKTVLFAQFGKAMSVANGMSVVLAALESTDLSPEDKEAVRIRYVKKGKPPKANGMVNKENDFFHARFGLFTYHADKWKLERPLLKGCSVDDVVEVFKKDLQVLRYWSRLMKELVLFCSTHGEPKYGASFEVCTSSWTEKQELKLHFHVCFKFSDRAHSRAPNILELDGVSPVHVQQPPRECLGPRAQNVNPMLYYLEMPKIGKVFHQTSIHAFIEYSVNPRWITGWLQGQKIRPADAAKVIFCLFFIFKCVLTLESESKILADRLNIKSGSDSKKKVRAKRSFRL